MGSVYRLRNTSTAYGHAPVACRRSPVDCTGMGSVIQVIGPVVDVRFDAKLPEIFEALTITPRGGDRLVLEVQQHLGSGVVRAVAMSSTEGLTRGTRVSATGQP